MNLFLLTLGCKPPGRLTEQHDVFFGIGDSLNDVIPQLVGFWPESGKLHLDGWRAITLVDGYRISIVPKEKSLATKQKLFFLNLGGYKPNELEEYHYKLLVVADNKGEAVTKAKNTAFYKHVWFEGATSHIDDKCGVDVDDFYEINDILNPALKEKYALAITPDSENTPEDKLNIGYIKLGTLI